MDKIKAIRIFVEVANCGSFSGAALRLGIVNSVVSKNVSELERWLGTKLVYRSTRTMRLTQDGMALLPELQTILNQIQTLEQKAGESGGALHGSVAMTAPVYLGQHHLLPIVTEFKVLNPEVNIYLNLSDDRYNIIQEGYDLALRVSQMPDSDFISRRLGTMVLKLVASPSYLSTFGKPASPQELKDHQCLIEGERVENARWRFLGKDQHIFTVAVHGNNHSNLGEAIRDFCIAGLGIAQLPSFFVDKAIAEGSLIEILPEYALDSFHIHLLYQKAASSNAAIGALIEHIYKHF